MVLKHYYYGRPFNVDLMKQNDNICIKYNDILTNYELKNVIKKPTKNGATLIDILHHRKSFKPRRFTMSNQLSVTTMPHSLLSMQSLPDMNPDMK